MRKLVIGDIHGNYKALIQCFERSNFDYKKDTLIALGDYVDGYPETKKVIDELLKIKNLIPIMGNHDDWALEFYDEYSPSCNPERYWVSQGGQATLDSYGGQFKPMDLEHVKFLKSCKMAHVEIDEKDKLLFVHGGINTNKKIEQHNLNEVIWDRILIESAFKKHQSKPDHKFTNEYKEIYIGHTSTQFFYKNKREKLIVPEEIAEHGTKPLFLCNVIALDTGAGWSGKLTIMDIKTKEYWQSDLSKTLYPGLGR